jgi:hypothetical protein
MPALRPRRGQNPASNVDFRRADIAGCVIASLSAKPHPDFGGRVAPAQFWRTVGNDIERCRGRQGPARFSQSSLSLRIQGSLRDQSAGFCHRSKEGFQSLLPE